MQDYKSEYDDHAQHQYFGRSKDIIEPDAKFAAQTMYSANDHSNAESNILDVALVSIFSKGVEYMNTERYAVCCRVANQYEGPTKHAGSKESRTLDQVGQVNKLAATIPVSTMYNPAVQLRTCLLATKTSVSSASSNLCLGIVKPYSTYISTPAMLAIHPRAQRTRLHPTL